ncbi:unnamed protein product [Caenorhabditis bovis]|uniref:Uncharacterized protein n=1 Tax=Caenorhabditis bovis TaxID=2654633 RepID=A0A8S1E646_9PELO|nr:unnamed protein product [Caenorhabditis bovis]
MDDVLRFSWKFTKLALKLSFLVYFQTSILKIMLVRIIYLYNIQPKTFPENLALVFLCSVMIANMLLVAIPVNYTIDDIIELIWPPRNVPHQVHPERVPQPDENVNNHHNETAQVANTSNRNPPRVRFADINSRKVRGENVGLT